MYSTAVIFLLISNFDPGFGSEPVCSRFHYEEKLLERMIRQEVVVEKMKDEMENMKHQVVDALENLKKEKEQIRDDLEKKENDIETMKDEIEEVLADVKTKIDETIDIYPKQMEKNLASTSLVVFKAHTTPDVSLINNKVIVFTESLFNMGDAYNNQTGIFVAPVDGIYLFTAQICVKRNIWMISGIFVEDKMISSICTGDKDWESCTSFDAIDMVQQGEKVSVKCASACDSSDKLWEYGFFAKNSFSGVLLKNVFNKF